MKVMEVLTKTTLVHKLKHPFHYLQQDIDDRERRYIHRHICLPMFCANDLIYHKEDLFHDYPFFMY